MDTAKTNTSTVRLPVSQIYGSSVSTEVTVFVLLTGILVGLLLVVIVLCVCKCCIKTSKPLKRQQVVFTKYSSERESTWNGKDTATTCTKYHSMEPRSSPSFSVPIDVEVGYAEGSMTATTREPEDRILEVSKLSPSNVRSPGDRVFPECSRELSPKKSPEEKAAVQFPSAPRSPGETRIYKSRRFPRSPPIQRQSSIYLPTSDEHLDSYLSNGQIAEAGGSEPLTATLATPEESSSFEEHNGCSVVVVANDDRPSTSAAASGLAGATRVSAEVHQVPRSLTDDEGPEVVVHPVPDSDTPPGVRHPGTRSSEAAAVGERKRRPVEVRSQQMLRPASATDVRDWESEGSATDLQHASSTEDAVLGTMLEVRCRENSRLLMVKHSVAHLSDDDEEPKSKVRYNDTGSMEEVNEEVLDMIVDDMVITPETTEEPAEAEEEMTVEVDIADEDVAAVQPLQKEESIALQYRKIWALRATFEEEEDEGEDDNEDEEGEVDNGQAAAAAKTEEDGAGEEAIAAMSTEPSPEQEHATSHTTSFESSTDQVVTSDCRMGMSETHCTPETANNCDGDSTTGEEGGCSGNKDDGQPGCPHLTLPTQESRRQSYKNILSKRVKRLDKKGSGSDQAGSCSVDNSFDSVETEGSSTDASRLEVVTTSMESTTDNTDSTGEGQLHRLQQMKADSGYKSLETNGSSQRTVKKQIHFAVQDDDGIEMDTEDHDPPQDGSDWATDIKELAATLNLPATTGTRRKERFVTAVRRQANGKTASKKRRDYTRERQAVESSFGCTTTTDIEMDCMRLDQLTGPDVLDEGQGKASVFLRFFRTTGRGDRPLARTFVRDFSIDEKSDTLFREFSRRDPTYDLGTRCRSPRLHSRHHRLYHRHADTTDGSASPRHARSKLSPQDSIEEEEQHGGRNDQDLDPGIAVVHIPIIKVAGEDSS